MILKKNKMENLPPLPDELLLCILESDGWQQSGLLAQTSIKFLRVLTEKDVLEKIVSSCTTSIPKWLSYTLPYYFLVDTLPPMSPLPGWDTDLPENVELYCHKNWCIVGDGVLDKLRCVPNPNREEIIYCHNGITSGVYIEKNYEIKKSQYTQLYHHIGDQELSILQLGYDTKQFYITPLFLYSTQSQNIIVVPRKFSQESMSTHLKEKHSADYDCCLACGTSLFTNPLVWVSKYRKQFPMHKFRYIVSYVPKKPPLVLPWNKRHVTRSGGFLD
jgi:hypothetical protein